MNNTLAEIINIVKTTTNNIDREDTLRKYFEAKTCRMVSEALEAIDRELAAQYGKDGEASISPLDKELGIHRYQRYSAYFEYQAAQIAAKTVYRTTAMAINALTPVTISHQQVGNIIKHVGERYAEWEKEKEQQQDKGGHITELKKPEVLYIEGDGLELKEQKGKHMEVHRFQIAEGVKEHKNRRELVGTHYIADFDHRKAVKAMTDYLSMHYDLSKTIVMSNSDGGSGYTQSVFAEILGRTKRHEHFMDSYHVNKKIKDRIAWVGKELTNKLHNALRGHDWGKVSTVLDTVQSQAQDDSQVEHTEKLRAYLERNWAFLSNMRQRGLSNYVKLIGTCESNHRLYSYRMKKQGRR
ncbi:ISLre2 family transposase [Selenomonas ruminis]|uniref:ISLre2 family transposase n=1 Tax=Selenomonas ruminis TaxID=2593411 RepID=A0A5D6W8S3_9FIRM|nr:ISLre2 family transposase [Selenomonas sp. mPRGC5]TYZ23375.1 ISLre2 family transposase [Selenomonas sp. mPRGC5]